MRSHKVLFLTLSGVRIYDEELRALGLTLPGFIERGETIAALPSLGLLTLAGLTPANWDVSYREFDQIPLDAGETISSEDFSLVAISALSARIVEAYQLADALRSRGVTVTLGGLHVSALPEEAMKHADAIVVGQGEPAWLQLLTDFEKGALRPRYDTPRGVRALNKKNQNLPRYDLLHPADYNRIPLQTMRGCPLDCSFCGASRTISDYQLRELDDVERHLTAITQIWAKPFIELADDNTFASPKRGRSLARLLKSSGARWFTETDISVADDDELLDVLADSGCAQLLIGLESSNRSSLAQLDSQGFKEARATRYAESIARIQSRGISVNGCFVLGFDEDEDSIFEDTLDLTRTLQLSEVQITLLTPFPGTRLAQSLADQGRLHTTDYWEKCTLFDLCFEPMRMSAAALRSGFRSLMQSLYNEQELARRATHFRSCLKSHTRNNPLRLP